MHLTIIMWPISSAQGSCMSAGNDDWALQASVLQEALEKDEAQGLLPFFLCATVGTTSSCAIDPLTDLGTVARQHSLW